MQHWQVYKKWNASLFEEMYKAWKEGRADKNPAEFWYKGRNITIVIGFLTFTHKFTMPNSPSITIS
jgi:hypothetical protein